MEKLYVDVLFGGGPSSPSDKEKSNLEEALVGLEKDISQRGAGNTMFVIACCRHDKNVEQKEEIFIDFCERNNIILESVDCESDNIMVKYISVKKVVSFIKDCANDPTFAARTVVVYAPSWNNQRGSLAACIGKVFEDRPMLGYLYSVNDRTLIS